MEKLLQFAQRKSNQLLGVQPNQELNALIITDESYKKQKAAAKFAAAGSTQGMLREKATPNALEDHPEIMETSDVEMKQEEEKEDQAEAHEVEQNEEFKKQESPTKEKENAEPIEELVENSPAKNIVASESSQKM